MSTHADLSDVCGGHLNDMVVDASGRAFVGDFGFDLMGGGAPASASVKRVDPDGTVTVVAEDLRFPNGSVITPDGGTLIVGETWGNRFTAFDIAADGSLTNRRVWGAFGPEPVGDSVEELLGQIVVAPDGCTLDAEGHIWVADGFGSAGAAGRAGRRDRRRDRRAGRDGRLRLRAGWGRRPRAADVLRAGLLRAHAGAGARGGAGVDGGRRPPRRPALSPTRRPTHPAGHGRPAKREGLGERRRPLTVGVRVREHSVDDVSTSMGLSRPRSIDTAID